MLLIFAPIQETIPRHTISVSKKYSHLRRKELGTSKETYSRIRQLLEMRKDAIQRQ